MENRNGYQPLKRTIPIPEPPTTGSNVVHPSRVVKITVNDGNELKDACYAVRKCMTNRERINNMSDEELYEFIVGDELERLKFENTSFHEHFLDWLQQDSN